MDSSYALAFVGSVPFFEYHADGHQSRIVWSVPLAFGVVAHRAPKYRDGCVVLHEGAVAQPALGAAFPNPSLGGPLVGDQYRLWNDGLILHVFGDVYSIAANVDRVHHVRQHVGW